MLSESKLTQITQLRGTKKPLKVKNLLDYVLGESKLTQITQLPGSQIVSN